VEEIFAGSADKSLPFRSQKIVFVIDGADVGHVGRPPNVSPGDHEHGQGRAGATIASNSPTAMMQFIRLVRESKHPDRRLKHDTAALDAGRVKFSARAVRLRAFLRYEDP
jgi:hypothetical protein